MSSDDASSYKELGDAIAIGFMIFFNPWGPSPLREAMGIGCVDRTNAVCHFCGCNYNQHPMGVESCSECESCPGYADAKNNYKW